MFKVLSRFMFWLAGWKISNPYPDEVQRCILVSVPHTSNWDFFYAIFAFRLLDIKARFTIKKEWMRFPFNLIMKPLGALPIDRGPKNSAHRKSTVEAMIDLFKKYDKLTILVTPEGTRSKAEQWRTGFYHAAVGAGVPIALGFLNYKDKVGGIGKIIYPSDFESDMKEIMTFYETAHPKYPEKFSVDVRYRHSGTSDQQKGFYADNNPFHH